MFHHYQRHILDTLGTATSRRYGELKPEGVDGNTFTYHLKQLTQGGYVHKNADGIYELTSLGRNYLVYRYEDHAKQAHSIFLMVVKVGEKFLLRERLVQPHLGMVGFVHGEPRHDENVVTTARRRLQDKTGLDIELIIRSSGLISISKNEELQSYSHAIILYGETDTSDITKSDATGRNFLASPDDMAQLSLLPSCHDILEAIAHDTPWFELSYDINDTAS